MSSIDDVHSRYAIDVQESESFKGDYNIASLMDTRTVSDHAKVLDYVPKPDAFDWLFGVNIRRRWAYFAPPQNFNQTRLFFFESFDSLEADEADLERTKSIDCSSPDIREQEAREKEKRIVDDFCDIKIQLREDYNFIMGRIHEFVRG
jgi:hypothetical protein